jgi:hypothetical protein
MPMRLGTPFPGLSDATEWIGVSAQMTSLVSLPFDSVVIQALRVVIRGKDPGITIPNSRGRSCALIRTLVD